MFLLIFPFMIKSLLLNESSFGTVRMQIEENKPFIIESSAPFMCLIFHKISRVKSTFYSNDQVIKCDQIPTRSLSGIDFGNNLGKIIFSGKSRKSFIKITYLVFPRECSQHRMISTLPYDLIEFTSNNQNEDFRITQNQTFCFWPAQNRGHYLSININSEDKFDLLTLHTPLGLTGCFSGIMSDYIYSPKGEEYFIWKTDPIRLSESFSIKTTNVEQPIKPMFRRILRGAEASDVQFFFDYPNGDKNFTPQPPPWDDHREKRTEKMLPMFIAMTAFIVVLTICVVVWCARVANQARYEEELATIYDEHTEDGAYYRANGEKLLPQPISL
ncbi:hypothetical protein TRFO_09633 [Tritrichomonas foetus]|uniref:CUB domain-containing protein n=1 Tax=Tritrichomonas foetus TaxID=1144522 RepID=A0A1J4JEJ7_9EUKA|nr:hypothetical protein TRFO_09633 [Tritrichomonas foetus]|eukprot:OHS97081.1 hypothetical protein TRFO_09633 [Tritrichomonas foetus]